MSWAISNSGSTTTDGSEQTITTVANSTAQWSLLVDTNALVGGATPDILEVRVKVNTRSADTEHRLAMVTKVGGCNPDPVVRIPFETADDATCTIKLTQGTNRAITWSLLKDDPSTGLPSNVKQNQALANFMFLMTDSTTHAPATGLTVSVSRSIDGSAFGGGTLGAASAVSNGIYKVDFAAGDLNGKVIILRATATGADDRYERIITTP